MKQQTFSDIEYANRRRTTKREAFLDSMETIIPWKDWVEMIRPFYPQGKRGRRPLEIETCLRMYLMQNWFNLSDVGIEDAIYILTMPHAQVYALGLSETAGSRFHDSSSFPSSDRRASYRGKNL